MKGKKNPKHNTSHFRFCFFKNKTKRSPLQELTCLRVKTNHSPTIITRYPEFAFCINAHSIRNAFLFFQFVYTPTVACRVEKPQQNQVRQLLKFLSVTAQQSYSYYCFQKLCWSPDFFIVKETDCVCYPVSWDSCFSVWKSVGLLLSIESIILFPSVLF